MDKLTNNQVEHIMKNATRIARENNAPISAKKLMIFIQMTEYALKHSPHGEDIMFDLSVNEMAREFEQSKRTLMEALKGLDKAGLITRIKKDENKSIPGVITKINRKVLE